MRRKIEIPEIKKLRIELNNFIWKKHIDQVME
jgi:hypothetical protein